MNLAPRQFDAGFLFALARFCEECETLPPQIFRLGTDTWNADAVNVERD